MPRETERPRVLFVDDEPLVLQGFRMHLRTDFDVVTAENGLKGLDALKMEEPFDVIVSDMRMPKMNGAEFLQRAREACPDTVRILLTGYADTESAIRAVNEGRIFRFLTKPCKPPDLIAAIREALAERRRLTADRSLLRTEASRISERMIQTEKLARLGSLAERASGELSNLAAIHRSMVEATIAHASSGGFVSAEDLTDLRWIEQSLERQAEQLIAFGESDSELVGVIDVRDAVARTLELLQVTGHLKHATIDFEFADEIPAVRAAPGRVQHAILNLIVNALEATADIDAHNRQISLAVEPVGDEAVVVYVEDNGPGIHPETRPFVFKPYFSTKKGHSGLGLSVASEIATAYGGELSFESRFDEGTRFKLQLPADDEFEGTFGDHESGVLEDYAREEH